MDGREGPDDRDAPGDTADDRDASGPSDARGEDETEPRSAASVATEGEEWRFTVDDLDRTDELTPGDVDLENALFVLLGVAFAVAVLGQLVLAAP